MGKMTQKLPPIIKTLSKKSQEKDGKIKWKLNTANSNWDDCKFLLHWNKIEWVNPRNKILRKKTYSTS